MNHTARPHGMDTDPKLDLVLQREIEVPAELVWAAWTEPEHLVHWFAPRPWTTASCEIDLRPGGVFRTVMRSPEGDESTHVSCYLEVVEHERLVWTDALLPGYRPQSEPWFTGCVLLEPIGRRTRYTAIAMHGDEATRDRHEARGFHHGWATALDQLVEHMQRTGG